MVGVAYVVARSKGRFEIRESVHTPKGPRARSLANFTLLSEEVLARAGTRATRPFDAIAVLAAADRAGAPIRSGTGGATSAASPGPEARQFVESSRRMARALASHPIGNRPEPGDALIDLLEFVAEIKAFQPASDPEPLRFPPLARLRAERVIPEPDQ
jgi:hypothetical protein